MATHEFDIAIAGGGLVGASLACALAPLGFRVAVIEAVAPGAPKQPSYDDRTLALSHASCRILDGLGLWPDLRATATPIREVIVTELGRPGRVRLRPEESGVENFGHVVEAREFGQAVLHRLADLESVEYLAPARVTAVAVEADRAGLTIEDEAGTRSIEAALLVAADGADSRLRGWLGIGAREKDYGQVAVICNVTPEHSHRGRAFERMTPTGPFALLPHRGDRCGLVWCVESQRADELLAMEDEEFLDAVTARSGGELGRLKRLGRRSVYPLRLVVADQDVARRAVILGNAAHAIHPAGAQGFNLGLRDVAVLAEVLATAGGAAVDPGAESALRNYADWRRSDRDATVAWTDGLVSLFASPLVVTGLLRTTGMLAHGLLPPLRRRLASAAMGYRGRIPRLALGESLAGPADVPS